MPRRDVVARARHRHGRGRPRHPGRVAEVGRARPAAHRPRGPRARRRLEGPHLPEVPRRPARVGGRRASGCATARSRRRSSRATRSTCSRSRSSRSAPTRRSRSTSCTSSCAARIRSPTSRATQLENVLDMLAGRYPSDEFAELRPRIVWDRTAGVIRGRDGARRLAVTNAGTIPDRGLFGVHLVDGGGRVGELDEEMVYEARAGQTFLLGASTWRIEEITRDRVLVSPAPGVPGRGAVLEGRGRRPAVRARRGDRPGVARARRAARATRRSQRLRDEHTLDERAARNLLTFLHEQAGRDRRRAVRPHGRGRALPRRDRRLARLHPDAVRRARARAVGDGARRAAARRRSGSRCSRSGRTTASRSTSPTPTRRRRPSELLIDPDEIEELVVGEVGGRRALFGARFRENAARALLIPRRRPGERTPLWQQRLKAQSLLQVARKYGSFPIILETYRECLQDVFDLPALQAAPARAAHARARPRRRRDRVGVAVLVARSSSTTSRRTCTRTTRRRPSGARRRCRSTATCCASCSARRSCATCSTRARSRRSRRSCAATPRNADELHDVLRRRGDLREGEYDDGFAETLLARAARVPRARRRRGAADRGRGRGPLPRRARRDAAGRSARRVPRGRRRDVAASSSSLRFARGRGPFTTARGERALRPRRRAGAARARARGAARPRRAPAGRDRARVVRPGRAAAAAARVARRAAQGGRAGRAGDARPLPAELARDRPARDAARGARPAAGARAAGLALGVARCCRGACPATSRCSSTSSARSGEVVWVGAGLDRVASSSARTRRARPPGGAPRARGRGARRDPRGARPRRGVLVRPARGDRARGRGGAARALGSRLGGRGDERRLDAAARRPPLRGAAAGARAPAPLLAAARDRDHGDAGPLVARPTGSSPDAPDRRALAELLLERQGIVTRDGVRAEGIPGGYGAVYGELRALETLGLCRRGYFVEGLGGAQFALAGAVERLRELRPREDDEPEALVLAAADPAQPYGAALPWPKRAGGARGARRRRARRPARRRAGALRRARRPVARPAPRARGGVAPRRRSRRSSSTCRRRGASGSRSSASTASRSGRRDAHAAPRSRPASSPGPRRAVLRP